MNKQMENGDTPKVSIDGHTIKVSGTIRPVKAVREYDFTKLVDMLIAQGVPKDEALKEVRELCEEIVTGLENGGK